MSQEARIGRLTPLQSGYWAIVYEEGEHDEIHSGDSIYVEVSGGNGLLLTRVEYDNQKRRFYSVDGYDLKVGYRAEYVHGLRF